MGLTPTEIMLQPEEIAILKRQLETIDDAVTVDELFAMVDEDLKTKVLR